MADPEQSTSAGSTDGKTVFEDPDNFDVKHPLQDSWTLWYDSPPKRVNGKVSQADWDKNLKEVYTFRTVEDFWALYHSIKPVTKLISGSNYHLFKEGIQPKWEDDMNEDGGKWVASYPKAQRDSFEEQWLWTMLAVIGGAWGGEADVCGVVASVRRSQDRIAVWTKTATARDLQMSIGNEFRDTLQLSAREKLQYIAHKESTKKNRSYNNSSLYEA